ncbi:MAG TPA: shikimate dehydrogenase [Candidatus Paceibacterota bacterium]|nr:shikimate dehydrogenase [Candidatus Paceibacterota bacterium]
MIRAAVLGSPISHSLSPALHGAAYEFLGIEGEYTAVEVKADELQKFLFSCDNSWTGFSLTMPLKEEVLSLADEVDDLARRIQSANTLVRAKSGWRALTTDVQGFQDALHAHEVSDFHTVLIIGSGATARAAASACDEKDRVIKVLHRSPLRQSAMSKAAPNSSIEFLSWETPLPAVDLMINTTPSGVADHFVSQIKSRPSGVYFEALYNPWPTKLLAHWRSVEGEAIDGLDLLVYQAIEQVALMTQKAVDPMVLAPILRDTGLKALLR